MNISSVKPTAGDYASCVPTSGDMSVGRLGGYSFRGTIIAGDGSNQKGGKIGAGYVHLRGGKE